MHGPRFGNGNLLPLDINSSHSYHHSHQDDWDSFPPAVKRKCFSTLERLRFAQGSALPRPKSASSHGIVKSSQRASTQSRPGLARRNSSYFKTTSFRRKKTPSPTSDTFSPSDAQWFLALPDKLQRRHFTHEERALLSGQSEPVSIIPDAADVRLYELIRLRETNRSVPTLRTSSNSSVSSLSTFTFAAEDASEPEVDMDNTMMDSFEFFDNDDELDLASTLDDYHRFYASETSTTSSKCQPSFRKVMSLSALPYGGNDTSTLPSKTSHPTAPTSQATTPTAQAFHTHQRTLSRPPLPELKTHQLRTHHVNHSSISTISQSAPHYTDPDARLKLRVFLASPQKFDEAIEFGFPSMEDSSSHPLSRPSLSHHATAPCKTFLHDDKDTPENPSLFDALDDTTSTGSTTSLPNHSPYTPESPHLNSTYLLSPSVADSCSSSTLFPTTHTHTTSITKPILRHSPSEPLAQVLAGNREMTLRMTLTRPDLRADEKALYAHTTGDDPLALEHLPVVGGNANDVWGKEKERGMFRRVWRKVSGRT